MTALSNAAKRSIKQAMGNARLGEEICDEIDFNNVKTFNENVTIADGKNIVLNTTTGTKIGTATTQKLGFFNATPVAQQATIADAAVAQAAASGGDAPTEAEFNGLRTDVSNLVTKFNTLLSQLEALGLNASA